MQDLNNFLISFGLKGKNTEIVEQAFIHISYKNSNKEKNDYEKLEFFGDSIISQNVSEFLYKKFPDKNVGELSKMRSLITQGKTEMLVAKKIGLDKFIKFNGTIVDSILEDVYEAFVGAIYLVYGRHKCTKFVNETLIDFFLKNRSNINEDYKTQLQELTYRLFKTHPTYTTIKQSNHEFVVKLFINNELYAEVNDKKIKNAEQSAAKIAFLKLQKNHKN
ncbi:MAG: ribonuclease III [Mycoplasmataceae bacterium]|jgi:ribonuclease-3|nr:ribonuclease III [Mycoplasmataceae bacterium]